MKYNDNNLPTDCEYKVMKAGFELAQKDSVGDLREVLEKMIEQRDEITNNRLGDKYKNILSILDQSIGKLEGILNATTKENTKVSKRNIYQPTYRATSQPTSEPKLNPYTFSPGVNDESSNTPNTPPQANNQPMNSRNLTPNRENTYDGVDNSDDTSSPDRNTSNDEPMENLHNENPLQPDQSENMPSANTDNATPPLTNGEPSLPKARTSIAQHRGRPFWSNPLAQVFSKLSLNSQKSTKQRNNRFTTKGEEPPQALFSNTTHQANSVSNQTRPDSTALGHLLPHKKAHNSPLPHPLNPTIRPPWPQYEPFNPQQNRPPLPQYESPHIPPPHCNPNNHPPRPPYQKPHDCDPQKKLVTRELDVIRLLLLYMALRPNCPYTYRICTIAQEHLEILSELVQEN